MAIKFEKLRPGVTYWDRHRYGVGNTTMTAMGEWSVRIISIDPEKRTARVVWNGCNPEETWGERKLTKLYAKRMSETKRPTPETP